MQPGGQMQSNQCGGSNFLLRYFSLLFCLISFCRLSIQARFPTTHYLMGSWTLGLRTVGQGGIAPRTTSFTHHVLTSSSTQYLSAFICTGLSSSYLMSSGVTYGPIFSFWPFIPTIMIIKTHNKLILNMYNLFSKFYCR